MSVFQAGLAVRDITPSAGCPLWGYKDRVSPALGTLDPLFVRTLAFRADQDVAALVVLDLGCPLNDISRERIRAAVAPSGVGSIFFSATHTHHGPVVEVAGPAYLNDIEQRVVESVLEAVANLRPARMGHGSVQLDIAHNRRHITPDGQCRMVWRNEEKAHTGPVDTEAVVLKIEGTDGKPIVSVVHFACHPVVMGSSNLYYSADYPGEMQRVVKEKTGAECVFLQGACGNINPYMDKTPVDQGGVDVMRATGRHCAESILSGLDAIRTEPAAKPAVGFVQTPVHVGCRWDMSMEENVDFMRRFYGPTYGVYAPYLRDDLCVPLTVLLLNDAVALVGMPGEIFVQYQLGLKQVSLLPRTLLCGYVNGFYGYFPTVADAAAGGYGGLEATFVGLGAGDRLVTEAQVAIGRMLGKFHTLCVDEPFTRFGRAVPVVGENC